MIGHLHGTEFPLRLDSLSITVTMRGKLQLRAPATEHQILVIGAVPSSLQALVQQDLLHFAFLGEAVRKLGIAMYPANLQCRGLHVFVASYRLDVGPLRILPFEHQGGLLEAVVEALAALDKGTLSLLHGAVNVSFVDPVTRELGEFGPEHRTSLLDGARVSVHGKVGGWAQLSA